MLMVGLADRTVAFPRRWCRAVPAVSAALLVCGATLVFFRSIWPGATSTVSSTRDARETAIGLRSCVDTAAWANGNTNCFQYDGGDDPRLCRPQVGWTCLAYKQK